MKKLNEVWEENQYHDENCVKTATFLYENAYKIGIRDYKIYVSNSGLTCGVKIYDKDHSGVRGRENDYVWHTHGYYGELNEIKFAEKFVRFADENIEKYKTLLMLEKRRTDYLKIQYENEYDLRLKRSDYISKILDFNPFYASKRNGQRLRGVGIKVRRDKRKASLKNAG